MRSSNTKFLNNYSRYVINIANQRVHLDFNFENGKNG